MIKLNPLDVKQHLTQYINNCQIQIAKGRRPTSICIEGEAGIGKTGIIRQIAEELGYKIHVENTSAIDDLGHLVGFPEKQYQFKDHDGELKWIPAEFADEALKTGIPTGEARMSYAIPHWLKDLKQDEKFILFLDDYTRALPNVLQACMTITEEYQYKSWKLPTNAIVMLSTNPDNGEYSVASMDIAQKTRMRYIQMVFDPSAWAKWAESEDIDNRCINFVLHNPEIFNRTADGIGGGKEYNARSMTKFFEDIGCLQDFTKDLSYVKICGEGCVGSIFTNHFITFINNKMDKLPAPKDLIYEPWDKVKSLMIDLCGDYDSKQYNQAIASLIAKRLGNYVVYGQHEKWGKDENARVVDLILTNCFSEDLKLYIARQFVTDAARKISSKIGLITAHPDIIKRIL